MLEMHDVAKMLAGEHASEDEGVVLVVWYPDDSEIRLVEVTRSISDRGEVLPFRFAAAPPDVPFPCVVVLIGEGDWRRIEGKRDLHLPQGWAGQPEVVLKREPAQVA